MILQTGKSCFRSIDLKKDPALINTRFISDFISILVIKSHVTIISQCNLLQLLFDSINKFAQSILLMDLFLGPSILSANTLHM